MDASPGNVAGNPVPALPYTLSGSASHQLGGRLSAALAWWQQVEPRLGRPLLQLLGSTVFSLAVAAQLGQQSLALAVAGLVIAYASGFGRGRWASNPIVSIPVPLFTAWLLGHAVYNTLRPISLLAAASFSLAFYGYSRLNQRLGSDVKGLTWPVVSQAAAVASLIAAMQPVAAAIVALLGTLSLLLVPLLETERGREQYFRAVQSQLAIGMLVTAFALGYTP